MQYIDDDDDDDEDDDEDDEDDDEDDADDDEDFDDDDDDDDDEDDDDEDDDDDGDDDEDVRRGFFNRAFTVGPLLQSGFGFFPLQEEEKYEEVKRILGLYRIPSALRSILVILSIVRRLYVCIVFWDEEDN
ncbi:hypothetical protein RRG08_032970 [Elysia crispata]|uniref:Uncharacterized protein n=1 Tax=Elysia crispata TaxID=231223 RepID=A0AAE1D3F4_9GAST|nr:hypothetical protein RRG08_032970 [Elysia crispata]